MEQNISEPVGNLPHSSEDFGKMPKASEPFRTVPKASEAFRTVPKTSERRENHILTVREAAKMFEAAGVTPTERSITNWCQVNKSGVPRLDAYFDSNDRKYFITPQSVDAAIKEELAKAAKYSEPSERFGTVPRDAEGESNQAKPESSDTSRTQELEQKVFDLQGLNVGKDFFIGQLKEERTTYVRDLMEANRRVGELETMLRLEGPKTDSKRIHVVSERETPDLEMS